MPTSEQVPPSTRLVPAERLAPPRVLLAHAHLDSWTELGAALRSAGIEVLEASSEREAEATLCRVDVGLVVAHHDVCFGEGKGSEGVERLRRAAAPGQIALITTEPNLVAETELAFTARSPVDIASVVERSLMVTIGPPVTGEQLRLLEGYFAALSERRWDELAAMCTPDVTYTVPGDDPCWTHTVKGREAFRQLTMETFASFPDTTFVLDKVASLPGALIARYRSTWSTGSTPITMGGSILVQQRGEQIRSLSVRVDPRSVVLATDPTAVAARLARL